MGDTINYHANTKDCWVDEAGVWHYSEAYIARAERRWMDDDRQQSINDDHRDD